jgi:hypothetical protein
MAYTDGIIMDVIDIHRFIAVAPTPPPQPNFSIDAILPSIVLLLGVATGVITVMTTLNKGQEEKINRLMHKIDELDSRLDTVNLSIGSLSDKYATKQELIASEHRIENYFIRLSDKIDNVIISSKP